ncbi:hypothetical protein PIB30_042074 [Stylosanthes scabra]|uniref:Protein FAR1-RELATED SEQUENCE n=1 Tax=Stylosanthes scabra TaxID=79078 RepID=A0ABU6QFY1_9FABA|nr:hypothetical protein [Stylosanthes scabra]
MNCVGTFKECIRNFVVYEVEEDISVGRSSIFEVTYDSFEEKLKCECLLFQSRGVACCHSLVVLSYERVDYISPFYILQRWSKHGIVQRRHSSIKSSFDEPSMDPRDKSYDGMLARSKMHCEVASRCPVLTSIVHRGYDRIEDEIKKYKEKKKGDNTITHENGASGMKDLQSPSRVRARGRPKKRLGSILEKFIASRMKKRNDAL